jgi:hypothetical protein
VEFRRTEQSHLTALQPGAAIVDTAVLFFCSPSIYGQTPAPSTPGPEHSVLHSLAGEWEVSVKDEVVGSATAQL